MHIKLHLLAFIIHLHYSIFTRTFGFSFPFQHKLEQKGKPEVKIYFITCRSCLKVRSVLGSVDDKEALKPYKTCISFASFFFKGIGFEKAAKLQFCI